MYNNVLKLVKIFWGILIFLIFWQGLVIFFKIPDFLLPSPILVGDVLVNKYSILFHKKLKFATTHFHNSSVKQV